MYIMPESKSLKFITNMKQELQPFVKFVVRIQLKKWIVWKID